VTGQNETTETNDARRLELVAAAQRQWIDALTDLGGRNTLLYYKDRRAGTLDLTYADPDATERFEKTGTTKLTRLFRDADARADAIRRMQTIYRKARELTEERGIRAGYSCAASPGARPAEAAPPESALLEASAPAVRESAHRASALSPATQPALPAGTQPALPAQPRPTPP